MRTTAVSYKARFGGGASLVRGEAYEKREDISTCYQREEEKNQPGWHWVQRFFLCGSSAHGIFGRARSFSVVTRERFRQWWLPDCAETIPGAKTQNVLDCYLREDSQILNRCHRARYQY